jgi:PAS domain S-box-containing protein
VARPRTGPATGKGDVALLKKRLAGARRQLARRDDLFDQLSVHREELQAQNDALVRAERELWTARDQLADLFERAPIPYLTLNAAAVIAQVNRAGCVLLGDEADRLVNKPFASFVAKEDRPQFRQHIVTCRRQGGTAVTRITLALPAGPVRVNLSSTTTNQDWIYTAVIDLSDREHAEEVRRALTIKAEAAHAASEAKDNFLAILSHELRTPLTPVLAAVSALERLCGLAKVDTRDLFATIRRNIGYEVRLIDDLLDVTRLTHGKLTLELRALDLHVVVGEALAQLKSEADAKGVRLVTALAARQSQVRGDADRLRQVFANLLRNAIKFTARDGEIAVVSHDDDGQISVAVRDNGAGLAADERERIFERFVQGANTRPRDGLGLGLPIVQGIVTAHGGEVRVFSEGPGKGSTFEVRLRVLVKRARPDARPRRAPASATIGAPGAQVPHDTRILFVEDHPDTARMMTQVLEQAGYQVTVADSVSSALAHAQEPLDLLVSDIGLPDGSGLDLMRQLLSRRAPLPGIALSGYGTREDIRRSRAAGFQRHLVKPIDVPDLLRAVEELRAGRGARTSSSRL